MINTLDSAVLPQSTASNTADSFQIINEKDFPQFMNFLSTHPKWPCFNSQIYSFETKQFQAMNIKQEPIEIALDRSIIEEENSQGLQKNQEQIIELQESQFSVRLWIRYDMKFMHLMNGEQVYNFVQQLQALTYRQLLEDEKRSKLPALIIAKKFLSSLELCIKPKNDQILECLAIDMTNPVAVTEFIFTYNQQKASVSDFEYLSKTISSCLSLKNLTLKLSFGKIKREDADFLSLIQSISQLKQLQQLTLDFGYQLNYRRLNFFFQAISQLPQLSYLKIAFYSCNLSQMDEPFNLIGLNNLSKLSTLSLNFSHNKMSNEGVNSLMQELSKLPNSISCFQLKMYSCDMNDQSATYLSQTISQLKNLQLLELLLGTNKITSNGMIQILKAINSNPSSLISDLYLDLMENSYDNEGVIQIASSLNDLPKSIIKLTISLPTKGIQVSGVEALSEALLSLVSLIKLKIILDSDEGDDKDTDDEEDFIDSAEKQAYLRLFKRFRKLVNLRIFSLNNHYLPAEDNIKRIIMKQLPGLVKIK